LTGSSHSFFKALKEKMGESSSRSSSGRKVHVVVGESRPLNEGVKLARYLDEELGYKVSLVTDAQVGHIELITIITTIYN